MIYRLLFIITSKSYLYQLIISSSTVYFVNYYIKERKQTAQDLYILAGTAKLCPDYAIKWY